MFCGKCGSPIREGNSFCSVCGAPIDDSVIPINGPAQNLGQPISQPIQTVPIYISTPQSRPVNQKNGFATAGLVLGIIALSCFWVPLMSYGMGEDSYSIISTSSTLILLSVLGILFSALGIAKSRNGVGKGKAITGLVLSIIGTFFCFIPIMVAIT